MPTFDVSEDQYENLNAAMRATKPIHDKLASGNTNLTFDEIQTYDRAYTAWLDVTNNL